MSVTPRAPALGLLQAAAMSGWRELAPALAPRVTLDASRADEPRVRLTGRDEVLAEIARWWPDEGTLVDWHEDVFADGALVSLERLAEGGPLTRLRLCVRWSDGRIGGLWAWEAQPRPAAAATPMRVPDAALPDGATREGDCVRLADGTLLLAERVVPQGDWVARATGDAGRAALLPHERLPSAVVDVRADPDRGWWVLRREVETGSVEPLEIAAAVHRTFAGETPPEVAARLEDRLALHAPAVAAAERGGRDLVPKQLDAGWEAFGEVAPGEMAAAVRDVLDDPAPLAARLRTIAPSTLVHGGLGPDAVGLLDGRPVLLGWGRATWAPAALEHVWQEADSPPPAVADVALAGLADRGWRLGLDALLHPDPLRRAQARARVQAWSERAEQALR